MISNQIMRNSHNTDCRKQRTRKNRCQELHLKTWGNIGTAQTSKNSREDGKLSNN